MNETFEVSILGIDRMATCRRDGSGMMIVHGATIGGTQYLSYERPCDCGHPDCYYVDVVTDMDDCDDMDDWTEGD